MSLKRLLQKRCGSLERSEQLLSDLRIELGIRSEPASGPLVAVALVKMGYDTEKVARVLTWQEFEEFCGNVLRASGFDVRANVILRKPRKQIDIFAASNWIALSIDCKHWRRSLGDYSLSKYALEQLARTEMLREKVFKERVPIVSVILTLAIEEPRILEGVAVVPLLSLRSFLDSVQGLGQMLRFI